jgi:hypothetical protein
MPTTNPLFSAQDLTSWLRQPVSDDAADVVERVVWGWLKPLLTSQGITERPATRATSSRRGRSSWGDRLRQPRGARLLLLESESSKYSSERRDQLLRDVAGGGTTAPGAALSPVGTFPGGTPLPGPRRTLLVLALGVTRAIPAPRPQTVTLVHVTTDPVNIGDETDSTTQTVVTGAVFEPERVARAHRQRPGPGPAAGRVEPPRRPRSRLRRPDHRGRRHGRRLRRGCAHLAGARRRRRLARPHQGPLDVFPDPRADVKALLEAGAYHWPTATIGTKVPDSGIAVPHIQHAWDGSPSQQANRQLATIRVTVWTPRGEVSEGITLAQLVRAYLLVAGSAATWRFRPGPARSRASTRPPASPSAPSPSRPRPARSRRLTHPEFPARPTPSHSLIQRSTAA